MGDNKITKTALKDLLNLLGFDKINDLAKLTNTQRTTLSRYVNGKNSITIDKLQELSDKSEIEMIIFFKKKKNN